MRDDEPTALQQRLLDREPVTVTLAPPDNSDVMKVTINWGEYGFQETNPYHRIATAWLSTLENYFEFGENEPAVVNTSLEGADYE